MVKKWWKMVQLCPSYFQEFTTNWKMPPTTILRSRPLGKMLPATILRSGPGRNKAHWSLSNRTKWRRTLPNLWWCTGLCISVIIDIFWTFPDLALFGRWVWQAQEPKSSMFTSELLGFDFKRFWAGVSVYVRHQPSTTPQGGHAYKGVLGCEVGAKYADGFGWALWLESMRPIYNFNQSTRHCANVELIYKNQRFVLRQGALFDHF